MASIKFKDFSAFYKIKKEIYIAVDNITMDIKDGEFFVVVGPSGCGKTTLLKCIIDNCPLTDGTLLIDGEKVENVKKSDGTFSYVAQDYSLYPQMTVFENIGYPLKMMRTPYPEIDKRVKKIAEELGISWYLTRKPVQLSGGQQQRVAIARALIKNPRVILFDEPFSNLEPEMRMQLRELVKEIHKIERSTFVFVTHDLSEAFDLADRIAVMNEGCIEQIGTPEEIRKTPKTQFVRSFFGK